MSVRFRIRRGDEELQADTVEEFVELVRAGRVSEGDLVHDALAGGWAPARSHDAWRRAVEADAEPEPPAAEDQPEPSEAEAEGPDAGGDAQTDQPDAGGPTEPELTLVAEEERSPEEEAEAFIAAMEEERAQDPDRPTLGDDVGLVSGSSTLTMDGGGARAAEPSPPPEPRPADERPAVEPPAPPRQRGPSPSRPAAEPGAWAEAAEASPGSRRRAAGILIFAILALAGTAAVAHPAFRFTEAFPRTEEPAPEARAPAAPLTDAELRVEAARGFVHRVDSVRAGFALPTVPDSWLEGRYLAEASAYPEVGEFWTEYLRYLEVMDAAEEELYREAYLAALDRGRMEGPVRSLRLARAMGDFRGLASEREDIYARLWEMAQAARALHVVALEREDAIDWEPARGERLSADPVTEAASADPEVQAELDAALDRVLDALYVATEGGRAVQGAVPDWLVRSLAAEGLP